MAPVITLLKKAKLLFQFQFQNYNWNKNTELELLLSVVPVLKSGTTCSGCLRYTAYITPAWTKKEVEQFDVVSRKISTIWIEISCKSTLLTALAS